MKDHIRNERIPYVNNLELLLFIDRSSHVLFNIIQCDIMVCLMKLTDYFMRVKLFFNHSTMYRVLDGGNHLFILL